MLKQVETTGERRGYPVVATLMVKTDFSLRDKQGAYLGTYATREEVDERISLIEATWMPVVLVSFSTDSEVCEGAVNFWSTHIACVNGRVYVGEPDSPRQRGAARRIREEEQFFHNYSAAYAYIVRKLGEYNPKGGEVSE